MARLSMRALILALRRLPPASRVDALYALQRETFNALGDSETEILRRYAAKTLETCLLPAPPKEQSKMLVGATLRALKSVDRTCVFDACASLTNLTAIHPRMVDPASFTASADDTRPVVVGPWLMEIGFELLYWIPYLRAQLTRLGIPKERVIAVSRGGAESWYSDVAGRYLDILDIMTPQEFHDWTSGRSEGGDALEGFRKAFSAGPFETKILDRVLKPARIDDYQVIMPSAMFGLLRNVWRGRFASDKLEEHLAPAPLERPPPVKLPFEGPYVAAKFYHSQVFPKSPGLDAQALNIVRELARRSHVVLLSNAVQLDDHFTLGLKDIDGDFEVFDARHLYGPRDNLAVQTALVANARELHGTYGGFSYLGPLLGVETVAYVGSFKFLFTHLDLAWMTFDKIGSAQLAMVPLRHGAGSCDHNDDTAVPSSSEAAALMGVFGGSLPHQS